MEFAAGIVELNASMVAQTAALEIPLVVGPASIVGAITAGDATILGALNNILNSINGLAPNVAFPTGPTPITNGGAAQLNTSLMWTTWSISLSPNDRPWPAVYEHNYTLRLNAGGATTTQSCNFVSLPVMQGTRCVATVSTAQNGRYILWRT